MIMHASHLGRIKHLNLDKTLNKTAQIFCHALSKYEYSIFRVSNNGLPLTLLSVLLLLLLLFLLLLLLLLLLSLSYCCYRYFQCYYISLGLLLFKVILESLELELLKLFLEEDLLFEKVLLLLLLLSLLSLSSLFL